MIVRRQNARPRPLQKAALSTDHAKDEREGKSYSMRANFSPPDMVVNDECWLRWMAAAHEGDRAVH
jgi:hypothetical protein